MKSFLMTILFVGSLLIGCKGKDKNEEATWRTKKLAKQHQIQNQLLDVEREQGWTLLFDGKTLNGWHLYNKPDSTHLSAWEAKDGLLFCNATDENRIFGDLVTDHTYENYELLFEWQIALRGNGGVFINVQESSEFEATFHTGPEYQLLEPSHMDTQTPKKQAGSLWGISSQVNPVTPLPVGQWNTSKIVQKDGEIKFYLNGKLTAKEDLKSMEWKQKLKNSTFKDNPNFGRANKGKIALQNWYFDAWFRNIKIRTW